MWERATYPSVPLQDSGRIPPCSAKVQSPIYQGTLDQYVLCFLPVFTLKGCVTWLWLHVIPVETLCGNPPVLELTERVWNSDSTPGNTVHYYCKEGFYHTGGLNVSVCNKDGQWSLPTLSCQGNDTREVVLCVPVVFLCCHFTCVTVGSSMQKRHLYVNFTNLIKLKGFPRRLCKMWKENRMWCLSSLLQQMYFLRFTSCSVFCLSYWHQFLSEHIFNSDHFLSFSIWYVQQSFRATLMIFFLFWK